MTGQDIFNALHKRGVGNVGISSEVRQKEKRVRNQGDVGCLARLTGGGIQERLGFSLEQSES